VLGLPFNTIATLLNSHVLLQKTRQKNLFVFVGLVTKAVCGFVPSISLDAYMKKSRELIWFLNTLQGNGHD